MGSCVEHRLSVLIPCGWGWMAVIAMDHMECVGMADFCVCAGGVTALEIAIARVGCIRFSGKDHGFPQDGGATDTELVIES